MRIGSQFPACSVTSSLIHCLTVEAGQWSGPLKSGYGTHLVLVTAREPASAPVFEKVGEKVLAEWQHDQQQKASQDYLARLREKYGVELDDSVKALLEPQPQVGRVDAMSAGRFLLLRLLAAIFAVAASLSSATAHEVRPAYLDLARGDARRFLRAPEDANAGRCASRPVGCFLWQDRVGHAHGFTADRQRDDPDLADARRRAAGRSDSVDRRPAGHDDRRPGPGRISRRECMG